MDAQVRRRALRAAAKVALSFTVMGCSTVIVDEGPAPLTEQDPVTEPEQPANQVELKLPATASQELMCNAPLLGEPIELSEDLLSCCSEELAALMPPLDDWDALTALQANPDAQACCGVLIAENDDAIVSNGPADWETLQGCCQVANWPIGPTCTPWGPPVPPAMVRRFNSLDELAALRLREVA